MSFAQRTGSLPRAIVAGAMVLAVFGALWGLMDQVFVGEIVNMDIWHEGSTAADTTRKYILYTWTYLPLVILFRVGLEWIIAARTQASGAVLVVGTVTVFIVHLFLVMWGLVFPASLDPLFQLVTGSGEIATTVQSVGYDDGVNIAVNMAFVYVPGLLAVVVDLWYLSAPLRRDTYAGYRG